MKQENSYLKNHKEVEKMDNGKIVNRIKEQKVILCFRCEGSGYKEIRTEAYENEFIECNVCAGKGRLLKTVSTTLQQV